MSNLAEKIMEKLKQGNIQKIPRWKFILKRVFIWFSLALAIIFGAFAFSMIIFQLVNVDWEILPRGRRGPIWGFFQVIPYFWALISIILFIFVYFDFKKTKTGYRYRAILIIGFSLFLSLLIGFGFYELRASEKADRIFQKFPPYRGLHFDREKMWLAPENGLLGGTILEIKDKESLLLQDFSGKNWTIRFSENDLRKKGLLKEGDKIRILGKVRENDLFFASDIRPMRRDF